MTSESEATWGDELLARPVLSETTAFSGHVFDVVTRVVDLGEAGQVTRDMVRHPGAVAVVALDDQGRVAMIRQYRVPVGAFLWEVPAGLLDGGPQETLLGAAQRELAEETDLRAGRWDVLADFGTSPGATDEVLRIFLARGLSVAPDSGFVREGEEAEIVLEWFGLAEAADAVVAGRVTSPSAVIGILAAERASRDGFASLRSVDAPFSLRPWLIPA